MINNVDNNVDMYYGVKQGKNIGVFDNWNDCKDSVDGYPNAVYRKFETEDEAIEFVCGHRHSKKSSSAFWKTKEIVCKDTGEKVFGYTAYLRTKHWKDMRRKVYDRFNGVCCKCGNEFALNESEIHHRSYDNLGNEKEKDCVLYCKKCHAKVERHKKAKKVDDRGFSAFLSRVKKELSDEEKQELQNYISKKYHIF